MTAVHAPVPGRPVEPFQIEPPLGAAAPEPLDERRRRRLDGVRSQTIDQLAIGAPLSAAMLALLLAESGRAAAGEAASGAAGDGTAPATEPVTAGAQLIDPVSAAALPAGFETGSDAGAGAAGAAGSGTAELAPENAVDPVVADAFEGPEDDLAIPPAADLGGSDGAEVFAGPEVSITFGSLAGMDTTGTGDGSTGTDGGGDGGTIGKHVTGGDGGEVIHGTDGNDTLSGGVGDDEIHGHAGDDRIDGGAGSDSLHGGAGDDQVLGGTGDDLIHGGAGNDDLLGEEGEDRIFGGTGQDRLDGGSGDDVLDGGLDHDWVTGGSGNDVILVDNIHDIALEHDRSADGGGRDTIQIGEGFATHLKAVFGFETATFILDGDVDLALPPGVTAYQQQLDPDVEHLILTGSSDHDVVGSDEANRIAGNSGDNVLFGRGGDDIINGGAGHDRIEGGRGDDLLRGGDGDDILKGGPGDDLLYGQAGDDTYVIGLNDSGVDTIFDHEGINQVAFEGAAGRTVQAVMVDADLHIVVEDDAVAVIRDYDSGHFEGLDQLLVQQSGNPSVLAAAASEGPDADLLETYLTQPTVTGSSGADTLLGTSSSDWLSGLDGNDTLNGGAGEDVLEGGAGHDRYLFRSDESGVDTIRDADGLNLAELHGFTGAELEGVMVGQDLIVQAHQAPVFKVENYAGNEQSFLGLQNGSEFVTVEDLFA